MAVRGHTCPVTIRRGPLCRASGLHVGRAEAFHFQSEGEAYQFKRALPSRLTHCLASTVASLADEVEGWGAQGRGRGALLPPWGVETAPKESPVAVSKQRGGDRWFCRESRET